MSLHLFSIALISISSNTDSFAVAIAYGIKKMRITIGANLLIAIISSLGTFISMSVGEIINGYLPQSIANTLGSGVLISIGIFGMWQTIHQERKHQKLAKYNRQNLNIDLPPQRIGYRSASSIDFKQSIPLAFSLTINNIGGGIGAGMSGLNTALTTGVTFGLAILAIFSGSILGEKFARRMTESWAGFLSSSLIVAIGIYEYFN
jgi:putative sporulation protein YtaF